MIDPDRERCSSAGRHLEEVIAEGSFGAGLPKINSKHSRNSALKKNERYGKSISEDIYR